MRQPTLQPRWPALYPRPPAPQSWGRRLQASSQGQLQTASRSPGAADPPRPSLRSPQPRAFVSHALTHGSAPPARTHPGSPGAHPQGARALAARTQGSGGAGGRKELTRYGPTDGLGWGKGKLGPGREGARRRGRGETRRRLSEKRTTDGTSGLARTRGLLRGWGPLQPLARRGGGGGQVPAWTRDSRAVTCPACLSGGPLDTPLQA